MSGKLIYTLAGVILLVIAVEGGYYWGTKSARGQLPNRSAPPISITDQKIGAKEEVNSIIPVIDEAAGDWVKFVNSLPIDALWTSNWQTSIGGKFISKDAVSATIETSKGQKRIEYPLGSKINFFLYDNATDTHVPISESEINPGDDVTVVVSIGTLDGIVSDSSLNKIINSPTPMPVEQ